LPSDGAAHSLDDARKFGQEAVARRLEDAAAMRGDRRVDQLGAQQLQPRQRALLVDAHQPRIARHIGGKDRSKAPRSRHFAAHVEAIRHLAPAARQAATEKLAASQPASYAERLPFRARRI